MFMKKLVLLMVIFALTVVPVIAKETYCNGQAKQDQNGNTLYPNGQVLQTDMGSMLYSNGNPLKSQMGNFLYPNGQPLQDNMGNYMYPNGKPVAAKMNGYFYPNGQKIQSFGGTWFTFSGKQADGPPAEIIFQDGDWQYTFQCNQGVPLVNAFKIQVQSSGYRMFYNFGEGQIYDIQAECIED